MSKPRVYTRPQLPVLERRLSEPRRFIQVVAGPRQVGKTTMVQQLLAGMARPSRYATADEPSLRGADWVAQQWEAARVTARGAGRGGAGGAPGRLEVSYWRDRGREVDFVVRSGRRLLALEVKSGARRGGLPGTAAFTTSFPKARPLLVGADGVPLEEFLSSPPSVWLER